MMGTKCSIDKDVMVEMIESYVSTKCIGINGVIAAAFKTMEDFQIADFTNHLAELANCGDISNDVIDS